MRIVFCVLAAIGAVMMVGVAQAAGRTIVCIGDSLTTCGGKDGRYTDWLAAWLPNDTIINKGIGGDRLAGGCARFKRDVLDLNPDVVIIELGACDYWAKKITLTGLRADLEGMVSRAKKAEIEVVIASCFGDNYDSSCKKIDLNSTKIDYAKGIALIEREVIKKHDCFYVANMQKDIKQQGKEKYWTSKNHPNKAGNEFVARRILKELKKALARVGMARARSRM